MEQNSQPIFVGETMRKEPARSATGEYLSLLGETYYKIHDYDAMEPFFMSIVSSSDHWLFVSSTGGLTAGRVSPEQALFPYSNVDKIIENHENTGNKAILLVDRFERRSLWEPLSDRDRSVYSVERNLYKNVSGTALIFEERNLDLQLTYRYAWRTSEKFGFVKTTWIMNDGDSPCRIELVDGLQNILPANVTVVSQNTYSSLIDAYKRSELDPETGLGIFALSSTLIDLAEPSESLLATTVAQAGLMPADFLLSSMQLERFRSGECISTEKEMLGRRGAYFVHAVLDLGPQEDCTWHLMADVGQDSAAIAQKVRWLRGDQKALYQEVEDDIAAGQSSLWKIVASADGIQLSDNKLYSAHHFANVMFNLMRGGIFADQYWIQAKDFIDYVSEHNRLLLHTNADFFTTLPSRMQCSDLQERAENSGCTDLVRLAYAYLPLTFSRRHGDPSRPWNRFAINIKKPDGSMRLDYEGNWRDIFQNWEALACSYPEFVESMISTFLNATTVDGYNPYRITYHGVDWEIPEPGNPWANIGYWSDHQIIYLQKLMEISLNVHPGKLPGFLDRPIFSYANVPYRIKPYADLLKDPYHTIDFDQDLEREIEARQKERGTDGKLVYAPSGQVLHATLAEKLLTLLLAKLVNFVPEGGIWMNTQRPEWNDANNALVGKGLSVVTLCYLRRYIVFCRELFEKSGLADVSLNKEVHNLCTQISDILSHFQPALQGSFTDEQRHLVMDSLGRAGSDYRGGFYKNGFSGEVVHAPVQEIAAFLALAQQFVEHTLRANQRSDALYHAYNVLHLDGSRASISHLYEMLEGQVAILSSGLLSASESLALLQNLRSGSLYQADRQSYLLYPDRRLPGFLEKNCLTKEQVSGVALFPMLVEAGDQSIITRDVNGVYHFSGQIHNFHDVNRALDELKVQPRYAPLVEAEFESIRALFEETFHHNEFTGRSGTFFAYEGLGSVYWHMVAKLLLAVQETVLRFRHEASAQALVERYVDIRQGFGFNKSPAVYGAFPTDPYSHTPKGQGAKQPGMTGQVKELILTRQAELGLSVEDGRLVFDRLLVDSGEFLTSPAIFTYLDVHGRQQKIELKAGSLAYSFCQTPVVLEAADEASISVHFSDGNTQQIKGNVLDEDNSRHIFRRDGYVAYLTCFA